VLTCDGATMLLDLPAQSAVANVLAASAIHFTHSSHASCRQLAACKLAHSHISGPAARTVSFGPSICCADRFGREGLHTVIVPLPKGLGTQERKVTTQHPASLYPHTSTESSDTREHVRELLLWLLLWQILLLSLLHTSKISWGHSSLRSRPTPPSDLLWRCASSRLRSAYDFGGGKRDGGEVNCLVAVRGAAWSGTRADQRAQIPKVLQLTCLPLRRDGLGGLLLTSHSASSAGAAQRHRCRCSSINNGRAAANGSDGGNRNSNSNSGVHRRWR
jgi:hypothetical protein